MPPPAYLLVAATACDMNVELLGLTKCRMCVSRTSRMGATWVVCTWIKTSA